jgi:hypothetical protein
VTHAGPEAIAELCHLSEPEIARLRVTVDEMAHEGMRVPRSTRALSHHLRATMPEQKLRIVNALKANGEVVAIPATARTTLPRSRPG